MRENQHKYIYKITSLELWQKSQLSGYLFGMPIDLNDGYFHFSSKDQLAETLRLYFKGQGELVIFAVATKNLKQDLKWEASRGGDLFPHLYAELEMGLVDFHKIVSLDENGETELDWLK